MQVWFPFDRRGTRETMTAQDGPSPSAAAPPGGAVVGVWIGRTEKARGAVLCSKDESVTFSK